MIGLTIEERSFEDKQETLSGYFLHCGLQNCNECSICRPTFMTSMATGHTFGHAEWSKDM